MASRIYVYNETSGQPIFVGILSNQTSYPDDLPIPTGSTTIMPGAHTLATAQQGTSSSPMYAALSFKGSNTTKGMLLSYTCEELRHINGEDFTYFSSVTKWSDPVQHINEFEGTRVEEDNGDYETVSYRVKGVVDITSCYLNLSIANANLEVIEGTCQNSSSPYKVCFTNNKRIKIKIYPHEADHTVGPAEYWTSYSGGGDDSDCSWSNPQIQRTANSNVVTVTFNMPTATYNGITVPEWNGLYYDNISIPVGVGDTVYDTFANRPTGTNQVKLKGTNMTGSSAETNFMAIPDIGVGRPASFKLTIPYYGLNLPSSGTTADIRINGGNWERIPVNRPGTGDTVRSNVKAVQVRINDLNDFSDPWEAALTYSQDITHYNNFVKKHKGKIHLIGSTDGTYGTLTSDTFILAADATLDRTGTWSGGGGGGGGVPCFIAGTKITLADGSKKDTADVTYDDELLVWNFYDGKFDKAKPIWIKVEQETDIYNKLTFEDGTTLGLVGPGATIGYHRIYNIEANKFTHTGVDETPDGTTAFTDMNKQVKVIKQELVQDTVKFYNIITDKHYNLFANGILTSCTLSNQYEIKDMKYVLSKQYFDKEFVNAYLEKIEKYKKETD